MVALAAPAIEVQFPVGGDLALQTGDRSRFPVDVKGREIVAGGLFGLRDDEHGSGLGTVRCVVENAISWLG